MRREKQSEHPSDEQLLAYLDGELALRENAHDAKPFEMLLEMPISTIQP